MDTVGERLRWAIEELGPRPRGRPGAKGSIRGFYELLKDQEGLKGKGASYQMIHRYLPKPDTNPDPTVPPEDFLRATAEVLSDESGKRLRWKWLATGEGEPTAEEAGTRRALDAEGEKAIQEHTERIESARTALRDAAGASVSPVAFAVFLHTWNRMRSQPEIYFDTEQLSVETFAQALMAPFHRASTEIGEPDFMELEDYIISAAPVIGRALGRRWRKSLTEPRTVQKEDTDG